LTDEGHEVTELKEDKVDVGDVGAAEEGLFSQKLDDRFHFLEQVHCDGHAITRCIAGHSRGSF